ncbi:hypothetical protein [Cohnella laeviribosi]|uniref:hypothetical protein n=1 Tax=Cohnella laeviribosi TaxID=380174 RepID=UPI00036EEEB4|nr:hypothetical protein [Cohnella laeviribosi]
MDWAAVLGIAAVLVIMVRYEWPQLKPQMKREKTAYAVLTAVGGALALLLVFYPEMPGPTQGLDALYKPLVKWMDHFIEKRSG